MSEDGVIPNSDSREPGRRLGRYRLLRRIGRGGMGEVFLARDDQMARNVAIKIVPIDRSDRDDLRQRLEREASAITQLEHPAIVPIYEVGESDGQPFIVMRYVEGVSLADWSRAHRRRDDTAPTDDTTYMTATIHSAKSGLSAGSAIIPMIDDAVAPEAADLASIIEVAIILADALDHAHRHGVIHRDIKPSNIMIDRDGHPHLLDFGLAKIEGAETISMSGSLLGTIPYMAPEQIGDGKHPVDARTDIYALGVTLFECLCGRRPFVGDSAEALAFQIVMRQPPSLRTLAPDVSRDIETVVNKCIEKDPARRYQRAAELMLDLRAIREHRAITARPVGKLGRLVRWAELHRLAASLAAALAVALIVLPTIIVTTQIERSRERAALDVYEGHLRRAREIEVELVSAKERLESSRAAYEVLSASTPPQLPSTESAKIRLFEARAEIERLTQRVGALKGEIEYEVQRSREAEDPIGRSPERLDFYRRLHSAALRSGDLAAAEKYRLFLAEAGELPPAAAPGRLSVVTDPTGAFVTVYPTRRHLDGTIRVDVENGVDIGTTPIEGKSIASGSWIMVVRAAGRIDLRVPILIESGEHWGDAGFHGGRFAERDWTLKLLAVGAYDEERWCRVPRGPFQSSPPFYFGQERNLEWRWEEDFLIGRREVTFDEYLDFIDTDASRAAILENFSSGRGFKLVPRKHPFSDPLFPLMSDGRLRTEDVAWFDPGIALVGISPSDADEYIAWLRARKPEDGVRMPRAHEWEKAARGVDGRLYPWGDEFDWSFTSGRYSIADREWQDLPRRPGRFPFDTSVYGCLDLAGNVREIGADGPDGQGFSDLRWILGGSWGFSLPRHFLCWPTDAYPFDTVNETQGLRLVRDLKE